ncbi:hypothetical protein [Streptomyces yaizuensis]|uniref:Lipoprotein n=1 Tax=Streptomyces yaizuensis TaxID=2989713 RepID=A0ABQ5NWT5_9ACTN|nr:hypothetical protein [Streptomyces sp. YSPA8]GLF94674.1 hypothetical protein SYYSPA8_10275 [Streptomyces sp. YSPA8]
MVSVLLLSGCGPDRAVSGPPDRAGTALLNEREAPTFTGFDGAKAGEEYRFALPVPYNGSARDIEITRAELLDPPAGLKVTGMAAYSAAETDKSVMLTVRPRDSDLERILDRAKDRIGEPAKVGADSLSDIYYMVSLRVTGPVTGHTRDCRYTYRQGGETYAQIVGCDFRLSLEK